MEDEYPMINQEIVAQIQQAPLVERLQLIELLVHSVKNDLYINAPRDPSPTKAFRVRKFDLGRHVEVDRDSIYGERTM